MGLDMVASNLQIPSFNLIWNLMQAGRASQNLPQNLSSMNLQTIIAGCWLLKCSDIGSARKFTQHLFYSCLLSAYYPRPGRMATRFRTVPHTHIHWALKKYLLTNYRNLPPMKADGSVNPAHI